MGEITTELAAILDTGALVWLIAGPVVVALIVGNAIRRTTRGWPGPDDDYPRPPAPRGKGW